MSMGQYFRYAGAATKDFGKLFGKEFDTIEKVARERVKDLQTQYIKLGRDANGAMKSIAIRPLVLDLEDMGTKTQIAAQKQQLLNQLLKQGSTNMLNWGKNTQWAGRQLMVGFTIPLTMLGQIASKTFMDMEEQVIKFQRVYGDFGTTAQQTKEMTAEITNLAKAFTKYGVAVSDTMGMAADAAAMGKMGADLLAQVESATRLAVLGGVDQKQALETTISLTNAFGVAAEDLTNKINFLNVVENQTVTSIEDLTIAVPKAGPVIEQLGGDVEDLAFFLTAMKEGGINASEGANALKSGLASIINPTKKASDMLAGMGINIEGIVKANKGDVKGIVVEFGEALNQLDPLKRAQAIEQLFGKFQFARLSTLFKNVTDVNSQAAKVSALAAQGPEAAAVLAQRELKKIEESPMFKFKKALEDLKTELVPLGEQFLKMVTPIAEFAKNLLSGFNGLSNGTKDTIGNITMWLAGFGPVIIMTIGLIANGIANMIKVFATIKSFLNGVSKGTQDLGLQTDYMTSQQVEAAAVAASLDQIHSKLRQTFTAEASAVTLLRTEMEKAVAAQRAFGWTPDAVPGKGKPRKKFAKGGRVSGSGSGDTVPALLTPGEFVVNKQAAGVATPFLEALNSGQVSGFSLGGRVGKSPVTESTPSQYENVFAHIAEPVAMSLENFAKRLTDLGKKVPADIQRKLDAGLGKATVRTYGGFGFDTRQSYNDAMKTGGPGVVPKDFLKDFEGRGLDKWSTSLKVAGLNLSDVSDELSILDKSIADQVKNAQKLDKNFVVTDKAIAEFTENALKPLRKNGSQLAAGFDRARNTVTEVRGNATQGMLSGAGFTRNKERGAGYYTGPNGETVKAGRLVKIGGGAKGKTSRGVLGGATMADFVVDGVKESTDQKSPSRKAKKAGEMIGVGALQGIEEVAKKAKTTVRTQAQQDAVLIASRTKAAYKNDTTLNNLAIQKKQAEMMGANTAAIEQEIAARRRTIAAQVKEQVATEASVRATTASSRAEAARKGWETRRANAAKAANPGLGSRIVGGAKKIGSNVMGSIRGMGGMGAGMGVMMGMGALTQAPGAVGQVAQGLMGPVSAAASAMMMIPGPAGIAVGAIAGLAMGAMQLKAAFDESQKKAADFAKATGASAEAIKGIAEATGKVSAGEVMDKRRENSMSAFNFTEEQNAVAESYVASEAGKKSISAVTEAMKSGGGKAAVTNMVSQMTSAVASGAISAIDAKAIVEKIGKELGDRTFALKVTGQMDQIIGSNGEALEADAVGTRQRILESGSFASLKGSTESVGNLAMNQGSMAEGMVVGGAAGAISGGGVLSLPNAAIGAVIGGITGATIDAVNYFAQLGPSSGAFAANLVIAQQNSQEMLDSLELQYDQRIANAKAAGDEAEAIRLQKEYEKGRVDILKQTGGAIQDAATAYTNFDTTKKTAVIGSLDTQIKELYQEGPMKQIAEDTINQIGSATEDGSQTELILKTSVASGDIDPQTMTNAINLLGEDKIDVVADMILKSGSAETDRLLQLAGMGSNKESQTATIEAIAALDPTQQSAMMSTLEQVGKFGGQQSLTLAVDMIGVEGGIEGLTELQTKYDQIDALFAGKGPITMEVITKTEGMEDVQMDAAWFDKLPKDQKKMALSAYLTVKETIDTGTPQGRKRIADWYMSKNRSQEMVMRLQSGQTYNDLANTMANESAKAAASTGGSNKGKNTGGNTGGNGGGSSAPTKSDKVGAALSILGRKEEKINKAYDERLKALDKIQQANDKINQQKKDQLDLADALSKGDIGAAARAQQQARENAQSASLQAQREKMEAARDAQIAGLRVNGMSRDQLEAWQAKQSNKADLKTLGKFKFATGGMVPKTQYFSVGGSPKGTDTISAMLTPGEFVVKKSAVDKLGAGTMNKINNGQLPGGNSVYNYSISVNVKSDADADQIANAVLTKIQKIDDQAMRGDKA
jgi:TP901 family phage tail tape measure protein